jgi:GYF domain 2
MGLLIYVHRQGQNLGPYSVENVQDYLASGILSNDDLAWQESATEWRPLREVMAGLDEAAVSASVPSSLNLTEPVPVPIDSASARSGVASWVPPRRDGSGSNSFGPPARISDPGTAFVPVERPIPAQSLPVRLVPATRPAPVVPLALASPSAEQRNPGPTEAQIREAEQYTRRNRSEYRNKGIRKILVGGFFFLVGGTMAVFLCFNPVPAHTHPRYISITFAIVGGAVQVVRGIRQILDS